MVLWVLLGVAILIAIAGVLWLTLSGKKNGPGEYNLRAQDVATYQVLGKDRGGMNS